MASASSWRDAGGGGGGRGGAGGGRGRGGGGRAGRRRRRSRVSPPDQGGHPAGWRLVRPAHRRARRIDAAPADAQPRHAAGHRTRHDQRSVRRHRSRAIRRAGAGSSSAGRRRRPRRRRAPGQILSTLARRAYRRPVAEVDLQDLMPFYTAGRDGRRLRSRHSEGARTAAGQPAVPVPHRARAAGRGARPQLPCQRPRARLAAVVLPVEQHPGR